MKSLCGWRVWKAFAMYSISCEAIHSSLIRYIPYTRGLGGCVYRLYRQRDRYEYVENQASATSQAQRHDDDGGSGGDEGEDERQARGYDNACWMCPIILCVPMFCIITV